MAVNLTVGPPLQGIPGLQPREVAKGPRDDSSNSFERTLGEKLNPKTSATPMESREAPRRSEKSNDDIPAVVQEPPAQERPEQKRATTAREQAIQKFMDSFESEFGIPPTKIVEAMALLQPQDLNKAPEETAEAVMAHLELSDEDQDKARSMYAALLQDLGSMKPASPFSSKEQLTASPEVHARLFQSQEKRAAMNQSVDQLNQKFWMTNNKAMEPKVPNFETAASMMASAEDLGADMMTEGMDAPMVETMTTPAPMLEGLDMEKGPSPDEMRRLLQDMKQAAQTAQSKEGEEAQPLKGAAHATAASQAPLEQASLKVNASPEMSNVHANSGPPAPNAMSAAERASQQGQSFDESSAKGEGESSNKKESSSGGKGFSSALSSTPQPLRMEDVAAALKATPIPVAGATAAALSMSPADNEANVRQLMNQAQYLIKKGGGEVNVEMSPEGLGQIQMKVLVKDGKVNVQMATENPEAKKAIESSLSDLRSSLAAHKLSMDHVKVDVVAGTNTDSQTRNDTNMNQNQQRDGARQFWNQFQENFGNRGAREGFWEMPSLKGYRQMKRPDPLQPIDAASVAARKTMDGKGSGLNLVA